MGTWIDNLHPVDDNIPEIWEHFLIEFEAQFLDSQKTERARVSLKQLKFIFPNIDQYIAEFEELCHQAQYTQGNPEVTRMFLDGFSDSEVILKDVMREPRPKNYHQVKM